MAEKQILAIVTKNREKVGGTGPIFFADSDEELVHTATLFTPRIGGGCPRPG